ncbi:MAG: 1-deoxy-D-xylulose-5-phosphate reductoisomerase [Ruminococcus sp.]|nr:1-deoxy-D-xylulose-5-phosphate reductoisomerase [Ruminococcus sp.]MCM1381308.1 1-deoxy-D-xylulose-5-phosphate reductoisomerase [Muribaculaceae bacterium]MCM1480937.1 1-deoxy-D-xylulose-5-phosphate reductoisomerase [Muribaculaceae bacterium]
MKTISLTGSTGSIGTQTLDVCRRHNIKVAALAANSSVGLLEEQAREFAPKYVCVYDEGRYADLRDRLSDTGVKVLCGMEGLCQIAACQADLFVNAVVGMVGLLPTLTAIENGRDVALANKETLVAGGRLVMENAERKGVNLYPIDSEHSAIFQCLRGNKREQVNKIILTASGGPFFGRKKSELGDVTVEQALNHPNWSMGNKITVDSATLMNKGLEFIEARWLFGVSPENIEIVVNRESVIHSAVEFKDFSVIAQLGVPDMKIPIQYALLYPERVECDVKPLSLTDYGTLTFAKPDFETFDCLSGCIEAIKRGGAYPCIVNAVNEEAVGLFLSREIPFLRIGELVRGALRDFPPMPAESYEDIKKAELSAREYVKENT